MRGRATVGIDDDLAAGETGVAIWTADEEFAGRIDVPNGLAGRCTLQLAYAIGVARPLSIYIDTHGTGEVPEDKLEKAVAEAMDLTPRGIRQHLDLNKPIYARTSSYGHFGRTPDAEGGFSWEKTDLADALKRAV